MERQEIIKAIKEQLETNPSVFALWLEGSNSNGSADQYSDIDLVADVADGKEDEVLSEIESVLGTMGHLDFNHTAPRPNEYLRYKIFHIEGTSEHLLIDVNIQSHSRDFSFVEGNEFEKPFVLFDQIGVIKFQKINKSEQDKTIQKRLRELEATFYQRSKVRKYIVRNKFLETLALYHKDVLFPLIELLRLKYTPLASDYYLIHISDHLPVDAVRQLEDFHKVSSVQEISEKLPLAEQLFFSTLKELKK
jgi:predicted nucleotidyltransferase